MCTVIKKIMLIIKKIIIKIPLSRRKRQKHFHYAGGLKARGERAKEKRHNMPDNRHGGRQSRVRIRSGRNGQREGMRGRFRPE